MTRRDCKISMLQVNLVWRSLASHIRDESDQQMSSLKINSNIYFPHSEVRMASDCNSDHKVYSFYAPST